MKRSIAIAITAVAIVGAQRASAQEIAAGPGTLDVTIVPGGGTFFTSKNNAPNFGNYTLGGTLTYNVNRVIGVEGEVGTSLGISQDLAFGGLNGSYKTPNTLDYSANLVASLPTNSAFRPYATGGVGGLTMFERPTLGVTSTDTFLVGNVGGGLKWYAPNGRWGVRGDYRFIALRGKDDAPAFFGQTDRYGHRVYGGIVLNVVR